MSAFPLLAAPTPRLSVPSRQHYFRSASSSGSPTRPSPHVQPHRQLQHVDDLIARLTPASAAAALRFPSGPLKACLDAASAAEQSFAMRAAAAATSIHEWLDELSAWPWPAGGGSAGFEEPAASPVRRRETHSLSFLSSSPSPSPSSPSPSPSPAPTTARPLSPSTPVTPERQIMRAVAGRSGNDDEGGGGDSGPWLGSLRAADVAQYEARLAEIEREIDDLQVENLKRHVLHRHILPLSPPGTPFLDRGSGMAVRAVSSPSTSTTTTATTSLSSPSVSSSSRLSLSLPSSSSSSSSPSSTFHMLDDLSAVVTAIVLQALPLLARLARLLDLWRVRLLVLRRIPSLLAALDAAEAAIRSAWDTVRVHGLRADEFAAIKAVVEAKVAKAAHITDFMLDALDGCDDAIPDPWIDRIDAAERAYGEWVVVCERRLRDSGWKTIRLSPPVSPVPAPAEVQTIQDARTPDRDGDGTSVVVSAAASERPVTPPTRSQTPPLCSSSVPSSPTSLRSEPELPSFHLDAPRPATATQDRSPSASPAASVIHHVPDPDAEGADNIRPDAGPEAEPGTDVDPTSSPPDFRASTRSTVTFSDMPTVAEIPEIPGDESPAEPTTPVDTSFVYDSLANDDETDLPDEMMVGGSSPVTPSSPTSPGDRGSVVSSSSRRMSVGSEDDQLQQQISEILESIPAKIHLSSQPAPTYSHLNPPDFAMPRKKAEGGGSGSGGGYASSTAATANRTASGSSMYAGTRSLSSMSSRSMTPSFLLAPAYSRNARLRPPHSGGGGSGGSGGGGGGGNQNIKLYHLSRSTGEPPIKLFIRLVGENGERVMVRVGGGWADLSEYLKEYASHHSRRSRSGAESQIEIRDLPATVNVSAAAATSSSSTLLVGSSPPSRPASALDAPRSRAATPTALTPLNVRKTRRVPGEDSSISNSISNNYSSSKTPRTPLTAAAMPGSSSETPPSSSSAGSSTQSPSSQPPSQARSRSSSRLSWTEDDSSLGMSGPRAKKHVAMSEESKAWVESVKERVRLASGERRVASGGGVPGGAAAAAAASAPAGGSTGGPTDGPPTTGAPPADLNGKFGEMGKVGGTKRLFRKGAAGGRGTGG